MTGPVGLNVTHRGRDDHTSPVRQLGKVVSLAAWIEPELIRAARLRLLPHLDVSAEADLWFSPLVQSRTPLAIVLRADVVEALRAELAADQRLLDDAWDVLQDAHRSAPPVLSLEEELTWLGLRGQRSDADVNGLLQQAVYSMVDEDRSGIARWTARAFDRLPQPVKRHETARMLNVGAKARLGTPIDPAETQDAPWWSWVVPSNLASISIRVRLLEGAVEIGSESSEWAHRLEVPKTNPPFVEVTWKRGDLTHSRQIPVPEPIGPVVVVTETSEAQIRTGLGDAFSLVRREIDVATPRRFVEFRLRFETERGNGAYRLYASGVAGEAIGSFKVPFRDVELENFILKIGRARIGTRRVTSEGPTPELELARSFGERLFSSVMDGNIGEQYQISRAEARLAGQRLRIALSLGDTPDLWAIPWEFLYEEPDFLSVSSVQVVRSFEIPNRPQALMVEPPLRILGLVSAPSDVQPVDKEAERSKLEQALQRPIAAGSVALDWLTEPSLVGLARMLRSDPHHVLHFVGHGGVEPTRGDAGLLFEDENGRARVVSGDQLASILGDAGTLRLVVLNASEFARGSAVDPFFGVATSLIQRAVPAVVGMQFEMTDRAMLSFSGELYTALAEGQPIDIAVMEGRRTIFADGNDIEWATPALYTSVPDGRIFDIDRVEVAGDDLPVA